MFINTPKPAAIPVRRPKRIPAPTANSPHVTRKEKKPALGSTRCCKNHTYHPCTEGLAPDDFASAPAAKPARAFPLVPQAGEVTFSHPATNHWAPTFMRTTNHSMADASEARKNLESVGSGKRSVEVVARKAERS